MASPLVAFLFASPWAALTAAVGAASIPIIVHLLNRNRYRIVTWAAMRFLLAAQRKNAKRMRIEQIVLLAVRTLIVVLLVAAMASVMPWAEELWGRLFPGHAVFAMPGSRRTHKILVIDGSFSMARKLGDGTCFDRAKELAIRIAREGIGGDGFSVVLMAAPPRPPVVSEPSDDARRVADEIQGLHLPHGNADLVAALNTVDGMLQRSPSKFDEREVYFLTDLQRSTWTARQAANPLPILQKIQGKARCIFLDVGPPHSPGKADEFDNLAITNLALGSPLATTGTETLLQATVQNYGTRARNNVRVEMLLARARVQAADPPAKLRVVAERVESFAAGQSKTVTFRQRFGAAGAYAVEVRLEGDELELDNHRFAVIGVKDTVPVMLVNGKPSADPLDQATEFLKTALNPFYQGPVPRDVPARAKVLSESQFADAGAGDVSKYDCVCLCDVARPSASEVRRLEAHLRRGGGVIIALGPHVDRDAYNRLLYRDGRGILPGRLEEVREAADKKFFVLHGDALGYTQAPLTAFAGDKDRAALLNVRFRKYMVVKPHERARRVLSFVDDPTAAPTVGAEADRKLDPAILIWNPPVPVAEGDKPGTRTPGGASLQGRVVLLASTVNMDWTTWPISPSYPPMMQELLRHAIAGRLREQSVLVGDTLEEYLPLAAGRLDVTMSTPDGRSETTRTEDREDSGLLRWADTDVSGVYRAVIGQHPQEYLFGVNVPAATAAQQACESDLTRSNADELQSTYPSWEFQVCTDLNEVKHSGGNFEARSGTLLGGAGMMLARWLLFAVLALLLAESVLAWWFGHYSTAGTAATAGGAPEPRVLWLLAIVAPVVLYLAGLTLAGVLLHAAWTGDLLGFMPDSFRRGIESSFGVPPPAPGEGTHWRLEFMSYLWDSISDPWLAGLLALAVLALVAWIYQREGRTAGTFYRVNLTGLRIGTLLLLLAVFLPQLRLWFERQGWPDVAIILDDSKSMSHVDAYQDPQVQAAAAKLAALDGLSQPQRLQLAQALLAHPRRDWLNSLLSQRKVKIHIYDCAARAARIADITDPADHRQIDEAVQSVRGLHADGDSSHLGEAVRQVLNDFRGSSLSAVIMMTDGVTTDGEELSKVARYASHIGVPLFFVALGDHHDVRDLILNDLQAEDVVHVNDRLIFEVRLTGQGYTQLTVPVTLREKGKKEVLARQLVKVDPNGKPVKVRLIHQPREPGEKVYELEVPVQPDEGNRIENNRLEHTVQVREARLIKVLYIEGSARYDFRYVKHLLERESAEDRRNKTIDLKVLLLDASGEYAKEDKSALAEFPTRDELKQFDVVVLGDADPRHPKLGEKRLTELANFVKERGGGMLFMSGEQYNPHAYRDTPLKDVLPVEVLLPEQEEVEHMQGYRLELTPAGRFHPIFRLSPDEGENAQIWSQLPELYWWSQGYKLKPAAEVLAIHPTAKADAPRLGGDGDVRQPLIVQQFVNEGRVLFFGINETWRWRFRDDELRFNQFWIQTMRYLARSRISRTELRLDRQTPYRRGDPIKVTLRLPDDKPELPKDSRAEVTVYRIPLDARDPGAIEKWAEIALEPVSGYRGTYEGTLTRTPEGIYRFRLRSPEASPTPTVEGRVVAPPDEMARLRMNRDELEHAAEESQGRFYTLADVDSLIDDLPAGTRVALNSPQPPELVWNHPLLFTLALGLLGSEWFLRKRRHLL